MLNGDVLYVQCANKHMNCWIHACVKCTFFVLFCVFSRVVTDRLWCAKLWNVGLCVPRWWHHLPQGLEVKVLMEACPVFSILHACTCTWARRLRMCFRWLGLAWPGLARLGSVQLMKYPSALALSLNCDIVENKGVGLHLTQLELNHILFTL